MSPEDRKFFETKIRPVLVKHCYECHSETAAEVGGKLMVDSADAMQKGGQSGPALVAGKPEDSLIVQALRYDGVEMPPDARLPENVIADFVVWISRGAADPRSEPIAKIHESDLDLDALWSFMPRQAVSPPEVEDDDWCRDPADCFVLARAKSAKHRIATDATPRELVRRLYYDLIGLPPKAERIIQFEREYRIDAQQATERLVDELLSSDQFGVRWGRHWLDVARYGESNGNDGLGRNASFPHAWRYRDYVIEALNNDLPYDQFLTQQIAGDLLPAESADQRNRNLVATGFLAIGSKPAVAMNNNFAMDVVDDQINAVCTAVMGLSVACARCHDHKDDPVPTRDYYALAGIFASTETLYGKAADEKLTAPPTPLHGLVSHWEKHQPAAFKAMTKATFPAEYADAIGKTQPVVYAALDQQPAEFKIDKPDGIKFDSDQFAALTAAGLQAELPSAVDSYSVAFWFKNDLPNNKNPVTAYLFSRAPLGNAALPGDHLGIGGSYDKDKTGKLFVFNGNGEKQSVAGTTVIAPKTWNHVAMIRDQKHVRVYLNGWLEIDADLTPTFDKCNEYCFGLRSEGFAPLTGNLAHLSVFDRAIDGDCVAAIYDAAHWDRPPRPARPTGFAMGVRDKTKTVNCKIHINGETGKLGPEVPRGVLKAYQQVMSATGDSTVQTQLLR